MELISNEPRLLCVVQISPNTFVPIAEVGLEGNISSLFCGIGIDCYTFGGSGSKSYINFNDVAIW
jgi:hypothetical protein